VRVGQPLRPEFAAWRYGDQLGRRRRIALMQVGLGLGRWVPCSSRRRGRGWGSALWLLGVEAGEHIVQGSPNKTIARLSDPSGEEITVRRKHLAHLTLASGAADRYLDPRHTVPRRSVAFEGDRALRIAGSSCPRSTASAARAAQVSDAVRLLERKPDPMRYFGKAAVGTLRSDRQRPRRRIAALPEPVRLALEMAATRRPTARARRELRSSRRRGGGRGDRRHRRQPLPPQSVTDFIRRHRKD
jgi:hypothetical protein